MHPTEKEIRDYIRGRTKDAIVSHLTSCRRCVTTVKTMKALENPFTWELMALPGGELFDDSAANDTTGEILRQVERAHHLLHVDAGEAVRICDQLLGRPECTTETEEGRHLSVLALRERANALRFLGKLNEASETVLQARALTDELLVNDYENAVLDYVEATILLEQDRLTDAAAIAHRSEETLTRFGDTDRANKARLLVAAVRYKEGDYTAARSLFLGIVESIEEGDSPEMLAGLLHNLADCEVRLGEFDEGRAHIGRAAELYRELEMTTELVRLTWLDARISLATDDLEGAEELFRQTETGFLEAGFALDAALVSLELVELYEQQGNRDLVVETATRLASVFAEAGARASLATTLAALRDAAVRGDDVTAPISAVRTTLEGLISASS